MTTAKPSAIELLTCPLCDGAFHHYVWAAPSVPGVEREKVSELVRKVRKYNTAHMWFDLNHDEAIEVILALIEQPAVPGVDAVRDQADYNMGWWLADALDDPAVCSEMKEVINAWFEAHHPGFKMPALASPPSVPGVELADAIGAFDTGFESVTSNNQRHKTIVGIKAVLALIEQPAVPGVDAVREALQTRCFSMSEPYLNGWRLIIGFSTREEVEAAQEAIAEVAKVTDAQAQTLCGMIAAIYGELDAEDCAMVDREWARMRGYILPTDGRAVLASPPSVPGVERAKVSELVRKLRAYHMANMWFDLSHDEAIEAALALIEQPAAQVEQPAVPGVERDLSENQRHAIAHAKYECDHASPADPSICFDYELVRTLLALIEQPASAAVSSRERKGDGA